MKILVVLTFCVSAFLVGPVLAQTADGQTPIPGHVTAESSGSTTVSPQIPNRLTGELEGGMPEVFKICEDQTYALCAVSSCYVYNDVAYCKCDVEIGDSISLAFDVDGEDVCDVNGEGPDNGYMVSMYSLPPSVEKRGGDMALYTCPAGSEGAYAQCDGGLCFTSTEDSSFPGFDTKLSENEIICSCPITIQDGNAIFGYQIAGPFPCKRSFFKNCSRETTNPDYS